MSHRRDQGLHNSKALHFPAELSNSSGQTEMKMLFHRISWGLHNEKQNFHRVHCKSVCWPSGWGFGRAITAKLTLQLAICKPYMYAQLVLQSPLLFYCSPLHSVNGLASPPAALHHSHPTSCGHIPPTGLCGAFHQGWHPKHSVSDSRAFPCQSMAACNVFFSLIVYSKMGLIFSG